MSQIYEETAKLEQKDEASAGAGPVLAETAAPAGESAPVLEYEEIPLIKAETELKVKLVKKKNRKGGVAVLAVVVVLAGIGAAAYRLGAFGDMAGLGFEGLGIENVTGPPEGAEIPQFSPIDPAEFLSDPNGDFIVVPDETGLELPTFESAPQLAPEPQNFYTQTPNVSGFFTRAAQDESYVYFLQGPAAGKYGLYDLMRMRTSTGKAELMPNANENSKSIYSFTLLGQNIITCEHRESTDTFAFYRVPKSGEDAQLLFETDSPAFMNVHDNKIFMLFVEEQTFGVFDIKTDTQPSYISLKLEDDTAHYLPQFSVINGYLYFGIWYDEGESMSYLRRSLYTGETVTLLSSGAGDAIWNPCWDNEGNAYYAQFDSDAMEFSFAAYKSGGEPQLISTFDFDGTWPLITLKDAFIVAAASREELRQYGRDDFSVELEAAADELPFAATKDFLVAHDGVYRLFDLEFIPFV